MNRSPNYTSPLEYDPQARVQAVALASCRVYWRNCIRKHVQDALLAYRYVSVRQDIEGCFGRSRSFLQCDSLKEREFMILHDVDLWYTAYFCPLFEAVDVQYLVPASLSS